MFRCGILMFSLFQVLFTHALAQDAAVKIYDGIGYCAGTDMSPRDVEKCALKKLKTM